MHVTERCALLARVSSLEAALVTPFYSRREAQGWYMYLLCGLFVSRGGMSEPYNSSLWRHGRWSGLVLDALERRAGHA